MNRVLDATLESAVDAWYTKAKKRHGRKHKGSDLHDAIVQDFIDTICAAVGYDPAVWEMLMADVRGRKTPALTTTRKRRAKAT